MAESGKDKGGEGEAGRSGAQSWLPEDSEPFAEGSDRPAPMDRDGGTEEQPTEVQQTDDRGGQQTDDRGGQETDDRSGQAMPWDSQGGERRQPSSESSSRVSVVDEQPPRPAPPEGSSDDEYKWHSYRVYPSGRPDACEFIDVYKAFGRSRVLSGLNMGLPEGMVSMILGPSGTGKSVCIKHMVGLLYPDQGDIVVHGESVPSMPDDDLFEMRKKFGLLFQDGALFGSMNLFDNVAFPLRQHTEKSEDEIEDIVMRRLTEVGLADGRSKMAHELSGGMRKRR